MTCCVQGVPTPQTIARFPCWIWLVTVCVPVVLLTGCGQAPLTYRDAQATALAGGCWPPTLPTPPLVTVTPDPALPPPDAAPAPSLPTTTPFPPCPPVAGATAVPWPTPVPAPPPYPTLAPAPWQVAQDQGTTLHLPHAILSLDLAVHPTEDWAAVAAVVWSGNDDPERVMLTVLHPTTRRWSLARQVDLGPARIGRYSRTVAVAITGDQQVHALWGMSDPDPTTGAPVSLWASSSPDFGTTWAAPVRIAEGCRRVNAVVAGLDGTLVAQLVCDDGAESTLAMVTRTASGTWLPVEYLAAPVRFYSEGSLVLVPDTVAPMIVGLAMTDVGGQARGYLLRRTLHGTEPWQIEGIVLTNPWSAPMSPRMWNVNSLMAVRPGGVLLTFTWTDADAGYAYALTSHDGGDTWGAPEALAAPFEATGAIIAALPAYEPMTDRLVVVWDCCAGGILRRAPTTHYASWQPAGQGPWVPLGDPAPIPLILGSRAVGLTVGAQAWQSTRVWVAWIEGMSQVEVRAVPVTRLLPGLPTGTGLSTSRAQIW
ncbi:exo-alpha-sialidase [Candidatus Chloroploca sp. M-50]|uniref:Exo-alpha-sialidase n=1 Tax=Candidatus Chloroploca mongolica TaxID=2528176 RepID=A0ABS4DBA4_9CHLR|nr:sialidase family protein [Candidatus Chloroploca mongolica]MBP1466725.1 exo-alpha-sialidase [Candidatus Chloroploca mongolica]